MKNRRVQKLNILLVVLALLLCLPAPRAVAAETAGSTLSFTPEEESFIASAGTLRVGYVQDRIPVSFLGENGELTGTSRYIFDRVSQLSGLKFEYVPIPEGNVTYSDLLAGGFDLISSVEYNRENQNARGILMSDPYFSSRKVVVARNDLNFSFDVHFSVAISTGSQTLRTVLHNSYPNFELVDYDSTEACFNAVASGEADLMIQGQYVAEYWFSKPAYEQLKVIPILGLEDLLCFSAVVAFEGQEGPSPERGEMIIGILNKAIAAISEDEMGAYAIRGLMENQYELTLSDFLYRYRYAAGVLAVLFVIIVVLSALLVRQRIRYAEDRADAKAKTQFLSTMSHEIRTPLNGIIGLNYLILLFNKTL